MFILNHAINSLFVKDNRKLKTGGKKVTFRNVNFLNHCLQNTRSCRKRNSFQRTPVLKASFSDTFKLRHALIRLRLDPALVKAASTSNIACPQLNGDTLISLYAVLLMLERVWTRLPRFSGDAKATHGTRYLFR